MILTHFSRIPDYAIGKTTQSGCSDENPWIFIWLSLSHHRAIIYTEQLVKHLVMNSIYIIFIIYSITPTLTTVRDKFSDKHASYTGALIKASECG